jgi:hypothetical protein
MHLGRTRTRWRFGVAALLIICSFGFSNSVCARTLLESLDVSDGGVPKSTLLGISSPEMQSQFQPDCRQLYLVFESQVSAHVDIRRTQDEIISLPVVTRQDKFADLEDRNVVC